MSVFSSPLDIRAGMDSRMFNAHLQTAEVRIGEPFCYDRDWYDVQIGKVVYPDQVAKLTDGLFVATGVTTIKISENTHEVLEVL